MKPIHILVLAAFLPLAAAAETVAATAESDAQATEAPAPFAPVAASDVPFDSLLYVARPIVVFADSPNDPNYLRQMELLAQNYPALIERDVVLVTDTDPAALGEWRKKLRPRGFSLVLMDKDLKPVIRKPLPWEVREITRAIDKFPLARQEMLERYPSGR